MERLWTAVYAPLGVASEDRRAFAAAAQLTPVLPLPMSVRNGYDQVIHGLVTAMKVTDGLVTGSGHWLDDTRPGVLEAIQAVDEKRLFPGLDLASYTAHRAHAGTWLPIGDDEALPEDAVLLFTSATIHGVHLTEYPMYPGTTSMTNL